MRYLVPIVEGQGEVEAVRALLYRIARALPSPPEFVVGEPIRVSAKAFMERPDVFRKYVGAAAIMAARKNGAVLILLDCDDDLPCRLGPDLLAKAVAVRADIPFIVALAHREYESWFLAAAQSLAGLHGLPHDLELPSNIFVRGAWEWFAHRMNTRYHKKTHQLAFTRAFDLEQARTNPSFDRFYRRIHEFLTNAQ